MCKGVQCRSSALNLRWLAGLDAQSVGGRCNRVAQRRRRRALPRLHTPQSLLERRALLEVHAVEEIHPAIGAGENEQLELWTESDLIFRREQRDLDATVSRQRHL